MKYELNPDYHDKQSFLLHIDQTFQEATDSIHKARNEIKIIDNFVVKSFKIPHIINKIAYSFFRPSKAKRAYHNALKISSFTPKPLGYCEFYRFGLLRESYFIAAHFAYDFTIREVLDDKNFQDREQILIAFADFTYQLHQAGILHKDYSPGNILIKKEHTHYIFQIVDINRLVFGTLSTQKALENFTRIFADKEDLKTILYAYATLAKLPQEESYQRALIPNQKHRQKLLKKWAKKEKQR